MKRTKKTKILTLVLIVFILVSCFVSFKIIALNYFKIELPNNEQKDFSKIVIEPENFNEGYISFENLKFKDCFGEFNIFREEKSFFAKKYGDNGSLIASISVNITPTVYSVISKSDIYSNKITDKELENFFEKNNIKNDIDIYRFILTTEYEENNFFDTIKTMKENFIKFNLDYQVGRNAKRISYIDSVYKAVVLYNEDYVEIKVIVGDDLYNITLAGEELTSEEVINEFLNTLSVN